MTPLFRKEVYPKQLHHFPGRIFFIIFSSKDKNPTVNLLHKHLAVFFSISNLSKSFSKE